MYTTRDGLLNVRVVFGVRMLVSRDKPVGLPCSDRFNIIVKRRLKNLKNFKNPPLKIGNEIVENIA